MDTRRRVSRFAVVGLVTLGVILIWQGPALARDKYETIDAQAFGTGTQLGQNIGVTLNIYEFRPRPTGQCSYRPSKKVRTRGW